VDPCGSLADSLGETEEVLEGVLGIHRDALGILVRPWEFFQVSWGGLGEHWWIEEVLWEILRIPGETFGVSCGTKEITMGSLAHTRRLQAACWKMPRGIEERKYFPFGYKNLDSKDEIMI